MSEQAETNGVRHIEPAELAYFKTVEDGMIQATRLDVEASRLQNQAIALRGAYESWTTYLVKRYELDPELDMIDVETGAIRQRQPDG